MKLTKSKKVKENDELNTDKQSGKSISVKANFDKNVGNKSGRVGCEEIDP